VEVALSGRRSGGDVLIYVDDFQSAFLCAAALIKHSPLLMFCAVSHLLNLLLTAKARLSDSSEVGVERADITN